MVTNEIVARPSWAGSRLAPAAPTAPTAPLYFLHIILHFILYFLRTVGRTMYEFGCTKFGRSYVRRTAEGYYVNYRGYIF